ncbi:hypothetical protein A9995_14520 [Erythrobacter sp. QSSC1-22B]|uniref:MerC domain-containing protein n=1 Tax=Erythrobacter sp. QSSC1-22B TaxID=1860125 RepID=UPI000804CDC9|nr:MerC domain-containing protein [Erythrobacter sp. QSSC1-22B]OBX17871.1 hypothetical protein A9995_14520 [Erythrobacter sp. QSSC1-22B]
MIARRNFANWLDGLAVSVSTACLIHCLALPALIALLPAWSRWLDLPETVHLSLLLAALPLSSLVLWRAARQSARAWQPFWLGIAGLSAMTAGLLVEGESLETIVTSIGAVLLASAHIINWRRRVHCRV